MVKIIFHIDHFDFRGTGLVIYNYAHYNELILKNESILAIQKGVDHEKNFNFVIERFLSRFEIYIYKDLSDLQKYCETNNIEYFYSIKYGKDNGCFLQPPVKNLIHCVYTTSEPHGGYKYFGVSETIDPTNYLYHIVEMHETDDNLRKEFNISEDEVVFGRHGGMDTFFLPTDKREETIDKFILACLDEFKNVSFIFMPKPYMLENFNHPKVHYLDPTVDPVRKRKFINTCDAMLHYSELGESFGLSVLEFSYCNKPVLTFKGGNFVGKENQQHLKFLKNKALLYKGSKELAQHMENIINDKNKTYKDKNWRADILPSLTPEKIMSQFAELLKEEVKITKIIKNYKNYNELKLAVI